MRILVQAGFSVIVAENGHQALEYAHGHHGSIDLLITDVVMPRLGGLELAKRLLIERPSIRIILVSGYSPEKITETNELAAGVYQFLSKPFTPLELLEIVARLIGPARQVRHASIGSIQGPN